MRTTTAPRILPLASLSLLMVATNDPLAALTSFRMVATEASKESISNSRSPVRMMIRRGAGGGAWSAFWVSWPGFAGVVGWAGASFETCAASCFNRALREFSRSFMSPALLRAKVPHYGLTVGLTILLGVPEGCQIIRRA